MQYTFNEETGMYDAIARDGVNPIAALPDDDEQQWALEHEAILPSNRTRTTRAVMPLNGPLTKTGL